MRRVGQSVVLFDFFDSFGSLDIEGVDIVKPYNFDCDGFVPLIRSSQNLGETTGCGVRIAQLLDFGLRDDM